MMRCERRFGPPYLLSIAVVVSGFVPTSGVVLGSPSNSQTTPPNSKLGSGTIIHIPGDNDWQLYRNDDIGFEVKYPETWSIVSQEPYGRLVRFNPPEAEGMFSGFSVGPAQPIRESWFRDFNRWLRDSKKAMTAAGETILTEERLTVSGYPALRLTYRNNLSVTPRHTVIEIDIGVPSQPLGQVFQFLYAPAKSRRYQQAQDIRYQQIISSLKISVER